MVIKMDGIKMDFLHHSKVFSQIFLQVLWWYDYQLPSSLLECGRQLTGGNFFFLERQKSAGIFSSQLSCLAVRNHCMDLSPFHIAVEMPFSGSMLVLLSTLDEVFFTQQTPEQLTRG